MLFEADHALPGIYGGASHQLLPVVLWWCHRFFGSGVCTVFTFYIDNLVLWALCSSFLLWFPPSPPLDICSGFVFFLLLLSIISSPILSFLHALIFIPLCFSYPCWAENSNMTWQFLRHSKVFIYFHKSLHYFFIVLSYIGFSFSSTLLVWGSILAYYVLLVVRGTKYLLFLCWFGTIFKLPFFSVRLPLFFPWRVCFMSDLLLVVNWVWFHQAIGKSIPHCRGRSCFQLLLSLFFF